jgi:hypothetical protein
MHNPWEKCKIYTKPEVNRFLGRLRHRQEKDIKMDLKYRAPQEEGNFLARWETISFARRTLLRGLRSIAMYLCVCKLVAQRFWKS